MTTTAITELIKNKGNEAFKSKDFLTACELYTRAAELDKGNPVHILNRSFANLRLQRYPNCISDATAAIALTDDDVLRRKALYRRCLAYIAQGQDDNARKDISAFEAAGAEVASVTALGDELKKPRAEYNATAPVSTCSAQNEPVKTYEIRESVDRGNGAFATRVLVRGDFILEEKPILAHTSGDDAGTTPHQVYQAARQLSPKSLVEYLSLRNSRPNGDILSGIWGTNAFAGGGICVEASNFNHSCLPNARYSWHKKSGRQRIIALTDIAPGEEIFVSYIMGRNNYGSTRAERQQRLLGFKYFLCSCSLCSAPPDVVRASDKRRQELLSLWNIIPNSMSPNLNLFIRAINLLKEEKYHADVDDFAVDAAAFCSMFSDWDATREWAKIAYEARRDEFGEDSDHTMKAKAIWLNPVRNPGHLQAGQMPKKKLGPVSNLLN